MKRLRNAALDVIEKKYIKILTVNLTEDKYTVIKAPKSELNKKNGLHDSFSNWLLNFANCGNVFFDDLNNYIEKLNIDKLREYFRNADKKFYICYRRLYNSSIIWVKMEIVKTKNYRPGFEEVCLYVIDINDTVYAINDRESQLEEKLHIEEKDNEILKSLAKIYYSIHLIDLEQDTISEIRGNKVVRQYITKFTDASEQLKLVVSELIAPSFHQKALDFIDFETLGKRIGSKNIITADLFGSEVGWLRTSLIPVEFKNKELHKVLFVIRVVTEEKNREQSLIEFSYTDSLTSLYNRRAYDDDLTSLKKEQDNSDLCFIVLDVNGLKIVNDTFGHQAGDELLKDTASILSRVFKNSGRCYRTGGDEFVVIAKKSKDEVVQLLGKLNELLTNHKGKHVNSIFVSVGFASRLDYENTRIEDLERIADQNMYQQKKNYYVNHR